MPWSTVLVKLILPQLTNNYPHFMKPYVSLLSCFEPYESNPRPSSLLLYSFIVILSGTSSLSLFRHSVHLLFCGFRYTSHCDDDCPSTEWFLFTLSHASAPHPHTEPLYRVLLLAVDASVPHPHTRLIGCYSCYAITKLDDIQGFFLPGDAHAPICRAFLLPRLRNHGRGRFHWPRDQ